VVKHIPGKQNIADSLSRLMKVTETDSESDAYVRFVAENATPNALSTRDIERESAVDSELSEVQECLQYNRWKKGENKSYMIVKDDLCVLGKLVLRGNRIVVPANLRERVL